jgi:hypothetical protein
MKVAVKNWVLKIELDGEWEQCRFTTRSEALAAFAALAADYDVNLRRAVLLPAEAEADLLGALVREQANRRYVN